MTTGAQDLHDTDGKPVVNREPARAVVERVLAGNLEQFYGFVQKRTSDPELARDVVRDSLLKAIEREADLKEETAVAWFYRVLRNAIVDRYRNAASRQKTLKS